jgi:cytochrome c5
MAKKKATKKIKKYMVSVPIAASVGIEVQATSKEQAIEKALNEIYVKVCYACSREIQIGDPIEEEAEAWEIDSVNGGAG